MSMFDLNTHKGRSQVAMHEMLKAMQRVRCAQIEGDPIAERKAREDWEAAKDLKAEIDDEARKEGVYY